MTVVFSLCVVIIYLYPIRDSSQFCLEEAIKQSCSKVMFRDFVPPVTVSCSDTLEESAIMRMNCSSSCRLRWYITELIMTTTDAISAFSRVAGFPLDIPRRSVTFGFDVCMRYFGSRRTIRVMLLRSLAEQWNL